MKAKIKDTGEVIDVHWVYGIDAWSGKLPNGCFREFKESELEFLETNNIDWEQRRYEIAKDIMAAFLSNSCIDVHGDSAEEHASDAVLYADTLIAELKKEDKYNLEEPRTTLLKEPELLAECTAEALLANAKKMHTMNRK